MYTHEELSVISALAPLDKVEQKHFHRQDSLSVLDKLPNAVWNSEPAQSEFIAFSMVANEGHDCWGTYYGPFSKQKRKDGNDFDCVPSRNEITAKTIEYWERRASSVVNPMLKMLYTGLVLDFKESVTGTKPDFVTIRMANIIATLEVAEECCPEYACENLEYCTHAIDIAVRIGNKELCERGAIALATNYKMCSSGKSFIPDINLFRQILRNHDLYPELMEYAVSKLMNEFENRELLAQEEAGKTDEHGHVMKEIAELLCEYHNAIKQPRHVISLLNRTTKVVRLSFGCRGGLWAQGMMKEMQKVYRKYHLYNEANSLYKDIIEQAEIAKAESQNFSFKLPISNELWDKHWQSELKGTDEDIIQRFLLHYLPDVEKGVKMIDDELFRLGIRVSISDSNGIPISYVGTGKKSEEQKQSYQIYSQMKISDAFLSEHVKRLKDKGLLSVDYILGNLFRDSLILCEEQRPIVKRGLEAFIEKDYIVACHLLIPQLENAIRVLCKLNGGEILRPKNDPEEGNEYKSLEGLLCQECVRSALTDNITTYFKVLFTDSNGGNLRNNVSHGLLKACAFNENMANRVFHAFLILSLVKPC